jgi:hypothetical protein
VKINGKAKGAVGDLVLSPDGQFLLLGRPGIVLRMPKK